MKNLISSLAFISLLSVYSSAITYSQEAHVHGLATLTLAIENDALEIQFESPAANLIGFEHKARTPDEKYRLKQAENILNSPNKLFSFSKTSCVSQKTTVDITSVLEDSTDSIFDVSSVLKNESHDSHNHHHQHDHAESHSEITSHYHFKCKNSKKIREVEINAFKQFPQIEKIRVMWLTESGQGSALLNSRNNKISFAEKN